MNKRTFTCGLIGTMLLTALVVGCGQSNNVTGQAEKSLGKGATPATATSYPMTFTDAMGQSITIKAAPQRIVSLLPSDTEILYALGLGDKIVGVTKWDDYPPEVKSKPVVGDMNPSPEAVVAQKPDLVLGGASVQGKELASLRALGLNVVAFEPTTIKEVEQEIEGVGKITNTSTKADQVVSGMEAKIKLITDKTQGLSDSQKPNVYVEISPAPDIFTAGKGTFMDEMITLAGGKNIAGDLTSWAKISGEQVVAKNPQVIISPEDTAANLTKSLAARSGWSSIAAVQNHHIYNVDQNLVSRPGPRIVDGLMQFAKAIHPELFQ